MPTPTFNLGKDAQLVVQRNGGALDLNVTEFTWDDAPHELMSRPLNKKTQTAYVPDRTTGSFAVDRNSNVLETLISNDKLNYYAGGEIPTGTVFAYITEVDKSVTTMQFFDVVFKLGKGGTYKQDDVVKQTLDFAASSFQVIS